MGFRTWTSNRESVLRNDLRGTEKKRLKKLTEFCEVKTFNSTPVDHYLLSSVCPPGPDPDRPHKDLAAGALLGYTSPSRSVINLRTNQLIRITDSQFKRTNTGTFWTPPLLGSDTTQIPIVRMKSPSSTSGSERSTQKRDICLLRQVTVYVLVQESL